jgi:hypothetical protein
MWVIFCVGADKDINYKIMKTGGTRTTFEWFIIQLFINLALYLIQHYILRIK